MREGVAALKVCERELGNEDLGASDILVDLDHRTSAHHAQVGMPIPHPRLYCRRLGVYDHDRVVRADGRLGRIAEDPSKLRAERPPIEPWIRREEGQLGRPDRHRIAVDGHAGTVGPPIRHLRQHRRKVDAEVRLDGGRFRIDPDDAAHARFALLGRVAWSHSPPEPGSFLDLRPDSRRRDP